MKKLCTILVALVLAALCVVLLPAEVRAADAAETRAEAHEAADLKFLRAPSLSFQDYIGMQLIIDSRLRNSYDEIYVEAVQMDPEKGAVTTKLIGFLYYNDRYIVFNQQILSWSMTEEVTMTLYGVKDGKTYVGTSYTYSVESMALAMLKNYKTQNAKLCKVLVEMLNYGAAVQTTYGYNTANLPNTKISDYENMGTSGYPEMDDVVIREGSGSVTVDQVAISMRSKVEIQLLFTQDISAYTPWAMTEDGSMDVIVDTETMAEYGYTIVRVPVAAAHMRKRISVALYDADGNAVTSVYSLSAEAFARSLQYSSQRSVALTMMCYGDAVTAYIDPDPTSELAARIIATAKLYLGVEYVYGGVTPDGFDCSGYMLYCFNAHGVQLPRTSKEQSEFGTAVSIDELKPGDLIFFDTKDDGKVNHVGLYMGNGVFAHASTKRGMEIAELFDGYWQYHYLGARRVL